MNKITKCERGSLVGMKPPIIITHIVLFFWPINDAHTNPCPVTALPKKHLNKLTVSYPASVKQQTKLATNW